MQTANNTIFSSQAALNGTWRNINNWFNFSLHVTGLEGNVWVEASNDPTVLTDGSTISAPATPVLSQYTPLAGSGKQGIANTTTFYVKNTFVTAAGETIGSSEASLSVLSGNLLVIASPAKDAGGYATGWNTYVSTTTGAELLQNLEDNAVIAPLAFGQNFILVNGVQTSGIAVPGANTSGSPNSGVNISGNLAAGSYATPSPAATFNQLQIVIANSQAMINPSGLIWNYVRVCKDSTTNTKVTKAFLFGQIG
jgi:hypothetical protein